MHPLLDKISRLITSGELTDYDAERKKHMSEVNYTNNRYLSLLKRT